MPSINMPSGGSTAGDAFTSALGQGMQAYDAGQKNKLEQSRQAEAALQDQAARGVLTEDQITKNLANQQTTMGLKTAQDTMKQMQDANSPLSKSLKASYKAQALIGAQAYPITDPVAKQAFDQSIAAYDDPNISGFQAKQITDQNPVLSTMKTYGEENIKGQVQKTVAKIHSEGAVARNAINVSKDYEQRMEPYRQINEDVNKIENSLNTKDKNGKPLISPQQLGDVNAAIARIYSPNHMSDSTVDRTEYESAPAKFAEAVQKWTANPHDIGSRELIDHIIDQAHHIANVSNQNGLKELESLDSGYKILSGKEAEIAKAKSNFYQQRLSKQFKTVGSDEGKDPTILKYSLLHKIPYEQSAHILESRGYGRK